MKDLLGTYIGKETRSNDTWFNFDVERKELNRVFGGMNSKGVKRLYVV